VALPAIAYHFGNKEGLYLACARHIVARYYAQAADLALEAGLALEAAPPPDVCSDYLRHILRRLLRLFAQGDAAGSQADFVAREMRDRGPAFQILYDQLWAPGVEITARLVAGCQGRAETEDADRAEALMLISSLLAFNTGRDVALQILGRPSLDATTLDLLDEAIDRMVEGIGKRPR
jgi:AcrR family transcriptional regulator